MKARETPIECLFMSSEHFVLIFSEKKTVDYCFFWGCPKNDFSLLFDMKTYSRNRVTWHIAKDFSRAKFADSRKFLKKIFLVIFFLGSPIYNLIKKKLTKKKLFRKFLLSANNVQKKSLAIRHVTQFLEYVFNFKR